MAVGTLYIMGNNILDLKSLFVFSIKAENLRSDCIV